MSKRKIKNVHWQFTSELTEQIRVNTSYHKKDGTKQTSSTDCELKEAIKGSRVSVKRMIYLLSRAKTGVKGTYVAIWFC